MTPLIDRTWELINVGLDIMSKADKTIEVDLSVKDDYKENFKRLYDIVVQYMESKENPLDRHKIASIIMISIIQTDVIKSLRKEGVFVGKYILATEVGLSYMLGELNDKLECKGVQRLEKYIFPKAMSCPTDYFRIFYRNLYYAHNNKEWNLNPLDIAERLFLLEYITLEKNGIDPSILNEY